jgi:hypothetical protein
MDTIANARATAHELRCMRMIKLFGPCSIRLGRPTQLTPYPDISKNVGPVKSYFERTSAFTPASGLVGFFHLCIDDHGSLVI